MARLRRARIELSQAIRIVSMLTVPLSLQRMCEADWETHQGWTLAYRGFRSADFGANLIFSVQNRIEL